MGSCDICFLTKHIYVRSKPKVLKTFLGNLVLGENLFYIHYVFLVQAQAMHQFNKSLLDEASRIQVCGDRHEDKEGGFVNFQS